MKTSNISPLLFEIGCEEIPARMLEDAREQLGSLLQSKFPEARLAPEEGLKVRTFCTPRRLVAHIPNLLMQQADQSEEIQGPSVRVAFDAKGHPTPAAEGFARKLGVNVQSLVRVQRGERGDYVAVRKVRRGKPALEILPELLERVIQGFGFPSTMYWLKKSGPRFVRPVRWILALLGEGKGAEVVAMEFAAVKAADFTHGNRKADGKPIRVRSFRQYDRILRKHGVMISTEDRRRALEEKIYVLLEKYNLKQIENIGLNSWIISSTEFPQPILGRFDRGFLALPRECLITVMEQHQNYIAVQDQDGRLEPFFIAVLDNTQDAKGLIRQGHERVLEARFRDARFFWETDQKIRFESRLDRLGNVTFQSDLGSYRDKIERMKALGRRLCEDLTGQGTGEGTENLLRALELSKCDLTTEMVKEFPSLQGIMGGLYAAAQGEPREVGDAIYDHYLPVTAEGPLPRSFLGVALSLVDKLDNVLSGFAVGLEPSGSSDPFALRRQGNGIIKLLVEKLITINLKEIAYYHINNLSIPPKKQADELLASLLRFFEERTRFLLEQFYGIRYDTVNAVVASGATEPVEIFRRARALEAIRASDYFVPLSMAAKRIANILSKSAKESDWTLGQVDPALLEPGPEQELYAEFQGVHHGVRERVRAGEFQAALERTVELRPRVDKFFDHVLIMAELREVRQNRLRLLAELDGLFSTVARFSEVVITSA